MRRRRGRSRGSGFLPPQASFAGQHFRKRCACPLGEAFRRALASCVHRRTLGIATGCQCGKKGLLATGFKHFFQMRATPAREGTLSVCVQRPTMRSLIVRNVVHLKRFALTVELPLFCRYVHCNWGYKTKTTGERTKQYCYNRKTVP